MSNAETLVMRFLGTGKDTRWGQGSCRVRGTRRESMSSNGPWGRAARQEATVVARVGSGEDVLGTHRTVKTFSFPWTKVGSLWRDLNKYYLI